MVGHKRRFNFRRCVVLIETNVCLNRCDILHNLWTLIIYNIGKKKAPKKQKKQKKDELTSSSTKDPVGTSEVC